MFLCPSTVHNTQFLKFKGKFDDRLEISIDVLPCKNQALFEYCKRVTQTIDTLINLFLIYS